MDIRAATPKDSGFRSFGEFYAFTSRSTGFWSLVYFTIIGTWGAVICVVALITTGEPWFLLGALLCGYSFAWIGHFRFERNRPATFRYPFYSFASDFRMWWELNLGKLKFREHQ
jgi:hypothetical protein